VLPEAEHASDEQPSGLSAESLSAAEESNPLSRLSSPAANLVPHKARACRCLLVEGTLAKGMLAKGLLLKGEALVAV